MNSFKVTLFYSNKLTFTCLVKSYSRASVLFKATQRAEKTGFPETFIDYKIEEEL